MSSVFLTGATGFVGSHVLRELLEEGYRVKALRRDPTDSTQPQNLEWVDGEMERVGDFADALAGCRYVVHCAALYSFAPKDRARIRKVNVDGTASLAEAARIADVERFVLTSSSATVGPAHNGSVATEEDYAEDDLHSVYHQSKIDQERAAFAGRVPVVALLPTAPVGPGDRKPTPTGKLILDFMRGKVFAKPAAGGLNLVPVEDVARAHVAALTKGAPGERYILGGENFTFDRLWDLLSEVTGVPAPRHRIPHALALAIAAADEVYSGMRGIEPRVPLEGVRMSAEYMFADSGKAERDLGFHASDVRAALQRAVQWFRSSQQPA